tara:strand:+ start:1869 stop:2198 length:330 start_codon:yes stop_codon:yes gene_type:complete
MRLYKNSDGVWAGTQADARKYCGKDYTEVDVPTDKPSLLKFLNLNKVGSLTSNDKPDVGHPYEVDVLNKQALSWIRWSYDKICSGQYEDCREMLRKGLELAKKEKIGDN